MASVQEAVSRLTIESRTVGVSESTAKVRQLDAAQGTLALSSAKVETATGRMEQALVKQQRALQISHQQSQQAATATERFSRSLQAANDNMRDTAIAFGDMVEDTAKLTGHLVTLTSRAYLLSPAFRALINPTLLNTLKLLGPAAVETAGVALSALSPLFALLGRIAIPLYVAMAAWKGLNYVVDLGSGLLDKYGKASRALFGEGVDENLNKLTKFQMDTISLEQVQYATELGNRLNDAKRTIGDFFKVQLDLTDPALKLQNAWVVIVELIAKATQGAMNLPAYMKEAAAAVGNWSGWERLNAGGWKLPGTPDANTMLNGGGAPTVSNDEAMRLARSRLSAGMGGGFAGRFTQSINDLANPPKPEETRATATAPVRANEYDRATKAITKQIEALEIQAKTINMTKEEAARYRIEQELLNAAKLAGITVGDTEREKIASMADAYSTATAQLIRLNEAQRRADEVNDAFRDSFKGLVSEFREGLAAGENAWDAFANAGLNALNRLADKLLDMAMNNLWEQAFPTGRSGGGGIFSTIAGALTGGIGGGGGGSSATMGLDGLAAIRHSGYGPGDSEVYRRVDPSVFNGAPRFHNGVGPGERAAIIRDDESVLTPGQMRQLAPTGSTRPPAPTVNVKLIESPDANGSVSTVANDSGGVDIEVAIAKIAAKSARTPGSPLNRALFDEMGARQRLAGR